jgi:hypothetical protein
MKKLVLAFTMVVLLAAAVFGGQAIASSKSNDVSVSEETSSILGSSYWGYPLRMKTISGRFEIDDTQSSETVHQTYPDTRHVHLTVVLNSNGTTNDGSFGIHISVGGYWTAPSTFIIDDAGFYIYEFDTSEWWLGVYPASAGNTAVFYEATITYPSNQW